MQYTIILIKFSINPIFEKVIIVCIKYQSIHILNCIDNSVDIPIFKDLTNNIHAKIPKKEKNKEKKRE